MFRRILILTVVVISMVSGCAANLAPVNNITNAPVSAAMRDKSIERVRNAIVQGLSNKGWMVEKESPGVVVGTVTSGGHTASVKIVYGQQAYSIMHLASSPGLKFDGVNIHRRYNHWIRLLNQSIQQSMVNLSLQTNQTSSVQTTPAAQATPTQPSPTDTQAEPAQSSAQPESAPPSEAGETAPEGTQ